MESSPDVLRSCISRKRRLNFRTPPKEWRPPSPPDSGGSKNQRLLLSESDLQCYLRLVESDPVIKAFHLHDPCCRRSDNYLLTMVVIYFKKANLAHEEYSRDNFFAMLYLAHEIEEERDEDRWELLPWALGRRWRQNLKSFVCTKNRLWQAMGFRGIVSRRCCEQVMAMKVAVKHPVFKRIRKSSHGNALRIRGRGSYVPNGPIWHRDIDMFAKSYKKWPAHKSCQLCNVKESIKEPQEMEAIRKLFDAAAKQMGDMTESSSPLTNVSILSTGLDVVTDECESDDDLRVSVDKIINGLDLVEDDDDNGSSEMELFCEHSQDLPPSKKPRGLADDLNMDHVQRMNLNGIGEQDILSLLFSDDEDL